MAEYIDREALYEKAYWHGEHLDVDNPFPDGVEAIDIKDVDAIPAADVAPVAHGGGLAKMTTVMNGYLFAQIVIMLMATLSTTDLITAKLWCEDG